MSAPFPCKMSDQRGERVVTASAASASAQAHTRDARGTYDAKTLSLMNTPAEPVPTEDTSAVTQEQASLQEQPARTNPHRCPRTLSYVADASNHSAFTCMQVRAFETKMTATLWADAHLCPRPFSYHQWSNRTPTRQGVECPVKKLEAILLEQQDYRLFAGHSSFGWSAGERGRFEIKEPFLECADAEPQLQGNQAMEKCAAVLPGKAPSGIKTNLLPTQKPVAKAQNPAAKAQNPAAKAQNPAAKAKASAPCKIQAEGWPPWRNSTASVLMAAFLVALVAMFGSALSGLVDATSLALPGGTQPALSGNATGDLDVVAYHPGIYFDPISNMADDQSSVLSAGNDLLHGEAVCGELGVHCDAGDPMTEPLHANMLRPTAPGLAGSRLSGRHQNATEGLPCSPMPKSLPHMGYMKLSVPTISSDDSGVSSSLAAAKEASLLAGSASFGLPKESALFAETVPKRVAQCSKGETNRTIEQQRHPSSSGFRSSVSGVGWPPQWVPFFLAQVSSPPQSPRLVQQRAAFSLSPNIPRQQPSPRPELSRTRSPAAPSSLPTLVASPSTGPVMRTIASDVELHSRRLWNNYPPSPPLPPSPPTPPGPPPWPPGITVSVSTVAELTAAVGNSAVNKIVLAAGTYELGSSIHIDRALTIEAGVPGAVVLNGMGARRVFQIQSGLSRAIVDLIGLNITGGFGTGVEGDFGWQRQGGGVFVSSDGVANFKGCNIHDNRADGGGVSVAGVANFEGCNIHNNEAAGLDESGEVGIGGGGVLVGSNGAANFESCNIHDNSVGGGGFIGGGGLLILGTATLTNTNVYSNEVPAENVDDGGGGVLVSSSGVAHFKGCDIHDNRALVCSPSPLPSHFRHRPLELTLEPTGCGVGACGFRVVTSVITAVASLSMEWQNLKTARSMTTPLMGCVAR